MYTWLVIDNIQCDIIEYRRTCFPAIRKLFRIETGDMIKEKVPTNLIISSVIPEKMYNIRSLCTDGLGI